MVECVIIFYWFEVCKFYWIGLKYIKVYILFISLKYVCFNIKFSASCEMI